MENIYKERLEKLATHLESGKLGHKEFNFNVYNDSRNHTCGTSGCAIGECPIVFKDEWEFEPYWGDPVLINNRHISAARSGKNFFNLEHEEYRVLFVPLHPEFDPVTLFEGKIMQLEEKATKEEVAANIRKFLELKQWN